MLRAPWNARASPRRLTELNARTVDDGRRRSNDGPPSKIARRTIGRCQNLQKNLQKTGSFVDRTRARRIESHVLSFAAHPRAHLLDGALGGGVGGDAVGAYESQNGPRTELRLCGGVGATASPSSSVLGSLDFRFDFIQQEIHPRMTSHQIAKGGNVV
jgi:hypothetical protein